MNPDPAIEVDSEPAPRKASPKPAPFDEQVLLRKLFWSVPESAFMCRVAARTVWRLMADPEAGFPKPRRLGARTLLARDEVLAHLKLTRGWATEAP